jgi:dihydrofolate synthase / folylpolyglutamate synthase
MRDKDIHAMLMRMAPLVDCWYFTDLATPRAARATELAEALREIGKPAGRSVDIDCLPDPAADPADRIVFFGSFYTVGGVLREGLPRLSGHHVG